MEKNTLMLYHKKPMVKAPMLNFIIKPVLQRKLNNKENGMNIKNYYN